MITVVTGLPRSGTTLMMRMLYRGGLQVVAEDKASFEHPGVMNLPADASILDECEGKAVKILEPLVWRPPYGPHYKFILMTRDPKEMMRSHAKFLTGNPDHPLKYGHRKARNDLYGTKLILDRYPHSSVLVVRFEDILKAPLFEARRVHRFLGNWLRIIDMASCVMNRGPECLPHIAEFDFEEEPDGIEAQAQAKTMREKKEI